MTNVSGFKFPLVGYTLVCRYLPGPPPQLSHEEEEVPGGPPLQLQGSSSSSLL